MIEMLVSLLVFTIAVSFALLTLNKALSAEQMMCWDNSALSLIESASSALAHGQTQFISQWQQVVADSLPDGVGKVLTSQNGSLTIDIKWLNGRKQISTVVFR